jgi:hypothetical protein
MIGAVMSVLLKEPCKGDGTANETMLNAAESMIETGGDCPCFFEIL